MYRSLFITENNSGSELKRVKQKTEVVLTGWHTRFNTKIQQKILISNSWSQINARFNPKEEGRLHGVLNVSETVNYIPTWKGIPVWTAQHYKLCFLNKIQRGVNFPTTVRRTPSGFITRRNPVSQTLSNSSIAPHRHSIKLNTALAMGRGKQTSIQGASSSEVRIFLHFE